MWRTRLSPRRRGLPASAAARRRGGGGGSRDRTEDRSQTALARPGSRRPRCARWPSCSRCFPAAALSGSALIASSAPARAVARPGGGPGRTDPHRERLPGPRAAPVRLPDPHSGTASRRSVEPVPLGERPTALVPGGLGRRTGTTGAPSRSTGSSRGHGRPAPPPCALPPDREIAAEVATRAREATWQYRARVIVHAPAEYVRNRLPIPVEVDSARRGSRCAFEPGSDHPEMLALYPGMLGADFTIVEPPELVAALRCADRALSPRHRGQPAVARRLASYGAARARPKRDGVAVARAARRGRCPADVHRGPRPAVRAASGPARRAVPRPGPPTSEDLRRVLAEACAAR